MLATELLFVYVYCLVDDAIKADALLTPRRPGPAPACTDAELLTIALVRHLLGRRSESGFLAEIRRDWLHLFPHPPHQSEVNRRIRWLWGAFEQLRAAWAAAIPPDPVQQIDTSALPVKHCSRVRGPDQWTGPGNDLAAGFGRDGAHAEWFYGFRLAVRTDLGRRIVRAWSIVPATPQSTPPPAAACPPLSPSCATASGARDMDDHQRLRHRENRCYPPFQGQQIWLEYDDLRAVNDPIRATVGDGDVVVDLSDAFSRLPMQAC